MALFKIFKGNNENNELDNMPKNDGYAYYTTDNGLFYIDADYGLKDDNNDIVIERKPLNAYRAFYDSVNTSRIDQLYIKDIIISNNSLAYTTGDGISHNVTGTVGSVTGITLKAGTGIELDTDNIEITSSGSRTISLIDNYGDIKNPYASKTKNYVLAAPNGSNGVPSFRALVAADIPNLNASKITAGTLAAARIPNLAASKITSGILPIERGGTGAETASAAWTALGGGDSGKHADNYFIQATAKGANNGVAELDANGFVPSSQLPSYGNLTNDGKIGTTADYAVYTTTGGAITAGSLAVTAPTASGTATAFISSVSQNSKGQISASKANLPTASTSTAGIIQIGTGATNAAAGNHNHDSSYVKKSGDTMTASLTITKAGECGVEVNNTQTTNPNQVAFIVGSSGNGGIYSRKHSKWIVYSDASGNVVLNGNANTATTASKLSNTSKIGDTNKPVYFTANGVPSAINYTIDKSVPSNAIFTDENVKQSPITATTSAEYRILLSGNTDDEEHTTKVNKNTNLKFNTGTKLFSVGGDISVTGNLTAGSLSVTGNTNFTQIPTAPTPADNSNDTSIATTAFVKKAFITNDAMIFKGVIGEGSGMISSLPPTTNEPEYKQGWVYKVGTTGTYAGQHCEIGDTIYCIADGTTANNDNWVVLQTNIDGYVFGPTDTTTGITQDGIALFTGTTGKAIKDSGKTITTTVPTANSADTTIPTSKAVWSAINNLDVSITGFGAGKTLSALSETDGKISASFQDISITKSQVSDFPTSMPASDVSAWAKASTKPSYTWSEISNKPNRAGSDSDGGPAQTVKGSYTWSGGQQNPNYFGKNQVGFLMMNTTVNNNNQYKDWIIMDCYNGNDTGGGVAFGVNRQSLGAYIMRSAAARTEWAESAELLGTHNYTNYTVKKDGTGATGSSWGISITGNAATADKATDFGRGTHTAAVTENEFSLIAGYATLVGNVSNTTMPHTNNANAEMIIKAHPTSGTNYYEARLGFSSNKKLYYMPVNDTNWKQIADTDYVQDSRTEVIRLI